MNKEEFKQKKNRLMFLIDNELNKKKNCSALIKLKKILDLYNYENRKKMKGLLTRTIIDSLDYNLPLEVFFFKFDDEIE